MLRTVEVLDAEAFKSDIQIWKQSTMMQLLIGDVFRMYEPDGTKVIDAGGYSVFKAISLPYITDDIPGVSVERYFL